MISKRFDTLGSDGAQVRLGLMGGTFDPIHIGHLRVAEEMRLSLSLDAVLFIPTGNPVFKKDQQVTDASVRLEMCRRAVLGNPHFDVSSIEVDREGDTFTVDTLRELRNHFPPNVRFFFIVGSDSAITVGKWRGCIEIAKLASLAVAEGRPGSAGEEVLRKAIMAAAPFDLHVVHVSPLKVASRELRAELAEGGRCRYLIPECVRTYIFENGLYGTGGVRKLWDAVPADGAQEQVDVFSKAFFKARKKELEQRVGPKRFAHSLGVSDACVQLAETYGVDVGKARLAGLLHDWDKGMDDEQARERVCELGMQDEMDPWVVEHMPRVLHGYTAARALGRDYPQIPDDVLQAIDRHTTAAEDMSALDMVLYIADAIEPSRQFGRIDELRAAVGSVSLEELYYQTYDYWTFLLFERKKTLHPDTMRIWNANVLRRQEKKKQK